MVEQGSKAVQITTPTKASDLPNTYGDNDRGMAKALARVDVAQVNFHGWKLDGGDGVADGVGIVGERARVDEDAVGPGTRLMNRVDDHTFVIALHDAEFVAFTRGFLQAHVDLIKRHAAIDTCFTRPKEIEIGAMDDGNVGHVRIPSLVLILELLDEDGVERAPHHVASRIVDHHHVAQGLGDNEADRFPATLFVEEHRSVDGFDIKARPLHGKAHSIN